MRKGVATTLIAATAVCMVSACSQNYSEQPADVALRERGLQAIDRSSPGSGGSSPQAAAIPSSSNYQSTAGEGQSTAGEGRQSLGAISAVPPSQWRSVSPSSSMRKAEYQVPGADGGADASLAIFAGKNWGSVDDNVSRWVGQFSDRQRDAGRRELVVGQAAEIAVTMVDVAGTFGGGMGGGGAQTQQRMLGAIVDLGDSFYYMKLLGPESTVTHWEEGFESFVQSIRR